MPQAPCSDDPRLHIPGVGRLEIRDDARLNLLETLHDEDALEHLVAAAEHAAALTALMRSLHEQGWSVTVSGGLRGGLWAEALVAGRRATSSRPPPRSPVRRRGL